MTTIRTGLLAALVAGLALSSPVAQARHHRHAARPASAQSALDSFTHNLGYTFTIQTNQDPGGMLADLDLAMPKTLPHGTWSLYLGMVNPVSKIDSDQFDIAHINGDLYRLTPKTGAALTPGAKYVVVIHAAGHFFSEYHVMPNSFVVAGGAQPRTIDATRPVYDKETGLESLPFMTAMTDEAKLGTGLTLPGGVPDATQWLTPERAFAQNAARHADITPPDIIILPTPVEAKYLEGPGVNLAGGIAVKLNGAAASEVKVALDDLHLKARSRGVPLSITVNGQGAPESYHLLAQDGKITITAADAAGAFYALESLAQQVKVQHNYLMSIEISDAPRFAFRGLHLDLARNFEDKAHILKVIGLMGRYKFNRLHLHLGDDEGWRLAISALPELTQIGSKRCFDLSEDHCLLPQLGAGPDGSSGVNGFLTRADYIDILKAARARHIEVIPSFDMPGHSRAAVRSMEARYRRLMAAGQPDAASEYRLQDPGDTTVYSSIQSYHDNTLNICLPSTYHFIDTVIDAIKAMHDEAGLPLKIYHIGTDETSGAWTGSPACQALMKDQNLTISQVGTRFITKVSQMLGAKGIEPAGWSDGMGAADPAQMPAKVQSNSWGGLFGGGVADAYRQANQGWDVVMSTPETLYFDMPDSPDPKERGYDWASRGTDLYKVFAFMPENLPANASVMTDIHNRGQTIADTVPLTSGHRITGMQGQLWSEGVRSDAIADDLLFPRTLALAERAWHTGAWEPAYKPGQSYSYGDAQVDEKALDADWQAFGDRLTPAMADMDAAGIIYRLPVPGARVTNGLFEANLAYGNLEIVYRTIHGKWTRYTGPVAVTGPVEVRSVAPNGKRFSRTITAPSASGY